ncbi:toxin glutamine deamidase domain-containing protein [Streptomyces sp. Da 82-17]|uniref:toxin glutamine deamidase domain-containing protein n=1 Tax=Streptomyces sp. Da 82-17 TaxID=3377116 RepID=UPI0038D467A8
MPTQSNTPDATNSPDNAADPDNPNDPADPDASKDDGTKPENENENNKDENNKDEGKKDEGKKPETESLQSIRDSLDHEPGGLREVDPDDQQALEDAVPRNEDGTPQRYPDPFEDWAQLQNDGGNEVPGRGNNCADCSRSFLETWYGNPQVSAPRTLDPDGNGGIDLLSPEDNANENQIAWSGAPHTYAGTGDDPDTPRRIEYDLLVAGPGSAAIVQVDWPGGGGHAFNAVNHNGKIVWIDTQTGEVSHDPIHIENAERAWHIPLDRDGNPLHPAQPTQETDANDENGKGGAENGNAQSDPSASTPDPTDPATDKPTPDNDATPSPTRPDDTTPDQSPTPDDTTPDESPTPDRATPDDRTSDNRTPDQSPPQNPKPDSDPRTADPSPSDPRATDPRTQNDPRTESDPRTQDDPRTQSDPRTQDDPRTENDPRTPDDPRKDDGPRDDPRADDRRPAQDDAQPHTDPDAQPDSAPDKSPDNGTDASDSEPARFNTDSTVPSRESLPPGATADSTRHLEDAVQNKKPLYGDIGPATSTSTRPSAAPDRPSGPADPSGTTDDPNERARQRAGDLQKLAWANSDEPEHKEWFKKFYDKRGYRIRVKNLCDDGFPAPQLHPADPPNRWMLASDAPEPEPESYTDWKPNQSNKSKLPDDIRERLDRAAEERQKAIEADRQPHEDRRVAKEALARNKTPENQKRFDEADEIHRPLHAARGRKSEEYGDEVAEFHAMPDNFPNATRVDDRATGNNRFDQIWHNPGPPPELVVVEAKGSTQADLGERRGLPDPASGSSDDSATGDQQENSPQQSDSANDADGSPAEDEPRSSVPRVKQGTRAYFETIVHEMEERGDANLQKATTDEEVRAAQHELDLAQQLRDSLDGEEGAPRIRYMLVKGKPNGTEHGGYEMSEFDIRRAEEKQQ